jgi:hypothetical protein
MNEYVKAKNFESRVIYRSSRLPGYCAWVSFFPGDEGTWYLGFLELEKKDHAVSCFTRDFYYQMGIAGGFDDTMMEHDLIIIGSNDGLKTWEVISHDTSHQREAFGDFAQAYAGNGRFIRFVWNGYSYEPGRDPSEILYISDDHGRTWQKQPPFHDRRFISYPHRLRKLHDGTLVLALPMGLDFDMEKIRCCNNLNAESEMTMNLCFSYDGGETWTQPLPIYGGHNVSETDFVELPSGDLLCINTSIPYFGHPGRQIIYRSGRSFVPGPYERAISWENCVPETVALTEDGILVGCMRSSAYAWSDDLGLSWHGLKGIPEEITDPGKYGSVAHMYQPWMQYLGRGKFACAGHCGFDDVLAKEYDNHIELHIFEMDVKEKPKETRISLSRDYDEASMCWPNSYTVTLFCGSKPLPGKTVELWWVKNGEPGGESGESCGPLDERIRRGGTLLRSLTDSSGKACFALEGPCDLETRHWRDDLNDYIYLTARFNADRADNGHRPAQTLQYGFYTRSRFEPGLSLKTEECKNGQIGREDQR